MLGTSSLLEKNARGHIDIFNDAVDKTTPRIPFPSPLTVFLEDKVSGEHTIPIGIVIMKTIFKFSVATLK